MFYRGENTQQMPLNIAGSATFGRYPQISAETTVNMFLSDQWLVNYSGYKTAIDAVKFQSDGNGRGIFSSSTYDRLFVVMGRNVYSVVVDFDQVLQKVNFSQVTKIGQLNTVSGIVYITQNNKPQLLFSDNLYLYIYDETLSPKFRVIEDLDFTPGYIDFHNTYFLCAVVGKPNWRISDSNEGSTADNWGADPSTASAHVGSLATKPDECQAVVRIPGKGNMILVFGRTVVEAWFDVGAALFPYQRNTGYNSDFGCLNPETIATLDDKVVYLGINEKSGPVIMVTDGLNAQAITTDGIDFFLSNLQSPDDAQAFMFRQDGHIIYHINFYSDNVSLFYDFNTKAFFFASDEDGNYFIASRLSFQNNQYYFVTRNNSNLYAFDTVFTTYDGAEIPRLRVCKNIRLPTQDYFVCTDAGFTIESGETNYIQEDRGPIYLTTEDGNKYITDGEFIFFITEDGNFLISEDEVHFVSEQADTTHFSYLIPEQNDIVNVTPRIDMAISIDSGEHFSSYVAQQLPRIGSRKNKLMWWQIGAANNLTFKFRFLGIGRFVATDGVANIRT